MDKMEALHVSLNDYSLTGILCSKVYRLWEIFLISLFFRPHKNLLNNLGPPFIGLRRSLRKTDFLPLVKLYGCLRLDISSSVRLIADYGCLTTEVHPPDGHPSKY